MLLVTLGQRGARHVVRGGGRPGVCQPGSHRAPPQDFFGLLIPARVKGARSTEPRSSFGMRSRMMLTGEAATVGPPISRAT